jgi:hypothetical protein
MLIVNFVSRKTKGTVSVVDPDPYVFVPLGSGFVIICTDLV